MLKAVIQNGAIVPLEPLPPDWRNGTEVSVKEVDEPQDDELSPEEAQRLAREANEWVRAVR